MPNLALSPLAPILGQRVPLRGPARLLVRSYARTRRQPGTSVTQLTTKSGDLFHADLSNGLEWQLWAFGAFEGHFGELFRLLVRPGDRCVDVGANIGLHTVRLAKLTGGQGEVIAVEPDPELAGRASRNIALNHLPRARVINAAASDRGGEAPLYRPDAADTNRGRASLLRHTYLTGAAATVPMMTVDEISGGPVDLIKIDVEGHEAAVVRGAAATIARDTPSVIFEYAPELLDDPGRTPFGWLTDRGYQMYQICPVRHSVSGRLRLGLRHLRQPPAAGGDILAIGAQRAARIAESLV
jgi:FkbM family methyltransferase